MNCVTAAQMIFDKPRLCCSFIIKDVFGSFSFSIDFFYIYIYCKKVNAEFNKLIKTVGHRTRCIHFEK